MKVHMLTDAVQSVRRFIKVIAAKVPDQNFLRCLELISHSMVVFDKAYNYYHEPEYHPEDENGIKNLKIYKKLQLRKVSYQNEKTRYFEFLTNKFEIESEEVAFLYKKRKNIKIHLNFKSEIVQYVMKSNNIDNQTL